MKITVATNGTVKNFTAKDGRISFDYIVSSPWSDFEIWVEDDNGKTVDYKRVNVGTRKKLKMLR